MTDNSSSRLTKAHIDAVRSYARKSIPPLIEYTASRHLIIVQNAMVWPDWGVDTDDYGQLQGFHINCLIRIEPWEVESLAPFKGQPVNAITEPSPDNSPLTSPTNPINQPKPPSIVKSNAASAQPAQPLTPQQKLDLLEQKMKARQAQIDQAKAELAGRK